MGQSPIILVQHGNLIAAAVGHPGAVNIENHLGAGVSHLAGNETRIGPGRQRPAGVSVSRLIRLPVP